MGCMMRLWPLIWALLITGLCREQLMGPGEMVRCGFSEGISVVSNCHGLKDLITEKIFYVIIFFFRKNKVVGNRKRPKRKPCECKKIE